MSDSETPENNDEPVTASTDADNAAPPASSAEAAPSTSSVTDAADSPNPGGMKGFIGRVNHGEKKAVLQLIGGSLAVILVFTLLLGGGGSDDSGSSGSSSDGTEAPAYTPESSGNPEVEQEVLKFKRAMMSASGVPVNSAACSETGSVTPNGREYSCMFRYDGDRVSQPESWIYNESSGTAIPNQ